eukprot:g47328.t1
MNRKGLKGNGLGAGRWDYFSLGLCLEWIAIWKNRNEDSNPSQKYVAELIKEEKRKEVEEEMRVQETPLEFLTVGGRLMLESGLLTREAMHTEGWALGRGMLLIVDTKGKP